MASPLMASLLRRTPRRAAGPKPLEPRSQLVAGQPVWLGAGVRRIVAPNAGMMTGPGTNTYLLGTRDVAVLDPGPDDAAHLRAILGAADDRIRWVIVTHTHRDHSPLAKVLAAATGATLVGMPRPDDGRQDDSFIPDRVPRDGETLPVGDLSVTAVHTPGHASNCVCYLLESEQLLFTGDHVLEGVSPVILPPDGDMSAYLQSIEKLMIYDFERIAPGHGGVMEHGKAVLEALRSHRLGRERKVLSALRELDAATLDRLTQAVYDDVAPDRHVWARLTLQAHLIKLVHDGQVSETGGVWRVTGA
jgi:glyoxylase-like metal-dependent hydrolase (beta-lactamase superfamily II)